MSRPLLAIGRWLPRGWSDLLLQLAFFFLAYQGYQAVRGLIDGKSLLAMANAERIIDLERSLGTFFEPSLQSWALQHEWLIDIANWLYINSHFLITVVFLGWVYLVHNRSFYFVRNMFMVAMGIALIGYAFFPTAPPRMLPDEGFVDTIAAFTVIDQDSNAVSFLVNKYAAVPSMHIGFSVMIAGAAITIVRRRAGQVLWALYPFLVFAVIVVTANHYWLDAAAGVLVAAAAALIAQRLLAPVRPAQWTFRERPSEARA